MASDAVMTATSHQRPTPGASLSLAEAAARLDELLRTDGDLDESMLVEAGRLAADLAAALPHRFDIERAKGVVMGRLSCGPEDAFVRLRELSQRTNRPLRSVAAEIAASGRLPDLS